MVQQEIQHVNGQNSVLVPPDRRIVGRDDNLLERVAHVSERAYLLRPLLLVGDGEGRLDVVPFASEVRHEVNLDLLVGGLRVPQVNYADVDVVPACPELVVDDVVKKQIVHASVFQACINVFADGLGLPQIDIA